MIKLTIIIVSYNVIDYLLNCIRSIYDTCEGIDYEIIVVDNASIDGTKELIKEKYPNILFVSNDNNRGFAVANNQAYKVSKGEYILLLNPDTTLKPGAIKKILDFMEGKEDAGICGVRLLNSDGSLQYSLSPFPSVSFNLLQAFYLDKFFNQYSMKGFYFSKAPQKVEAVMGALMMIRRDAIPREELLDWRFFMYSEEIDLCMRVKENGWNIYYLPNAEAIHHWGKSTGQKEYELFKQLQKSKIELYKKHFGPIRVWFLSVSLLMILLSRFVAALVFLPLHGSGRVKLFGAAIKEYPWG